MLSDNKNGVSVKLIHDTRLKNKEGLFPIRVQVIYQRTAKYYNTGKKMSVADWEKLPTSRLPEMVKIRNSVKDSFDIIMECVEDLFSSGYFSFDALNIRLGRISAGTLNSALKAKIELLKQEGQVGSMNYYHSVLRSIERFTERDMPFEEVTVGWLKNFEKHQLARDLSYSTIGMRMRGIRTIMTRAKREGLINDAQYPFGKDKYEIKTGEGKKKALNMEQIAAIANYADGNTETERYRDLWLFIYLCNGINAADLVRLKFNNIDDDEISFVREKTKRTTRVIKEIRATITPEMQIIIDKWGNPPSPDSFIFPLINHTSDPIQHAKEVKDLIKKINKRTKQIGGELGIGRITTYTARHSFATVLKRSGANMSFISESLGHSDLKTTESYLDSFEKEERAKNANLLTQYKKI